MCDYATKSRRIRRFWQQASTNVVKFVILLHQVLDDYVTLFQVYEHVISPDKLRAKVVEGETRFGSGSRRIVVDHREHLFTNALKPGVVSACLQDPQLDLLVDRDRHESHRAEFLYQSLYCC